MGRNSHFCIAKVDMENNKTGRPRLVKDQEDPLANYTARITFRQARLARRIGLGNLSEGIRLAIERAAADLAFMEALPPIRRKV